MKRLLLTPLLLLSGCSLVNDDSTVEIPTVEHVVEETQSIHINDFNDKLYLIHDYPLFRGFFTSDDTKITKWKVSGEESYSVYSVTPVNSIDNFSVFMMKNEYSIDEANEIAINALRIFDIEKRISFNDITEGNFEKEELDKYTIITENLATYYAIKILYKY